MMAAVPELMALVVTGSAVVKAVDGGVRAISDDRRVCGGVADPSAGKVIF
jgi:hypothetical protein